MAVVGTMEDTEVATTEPVAVPLAVHEVPGSKSTPSVPLSREPLTVMAVTVALTATRSAVLMPATTEAGEKPVALPACRMNDVSHMPDDHDHRQQPSHSSPMSRPSTS